MTPEARSFPLWFWTFALAGLAGLGFFVWSVTHEDPRTLSTNGGQDRLFCEAYCHDGGGYLAEFGNGDYATPRCSCLALDSDPE